MRRVFLYLILIIFFSIIIRDALVGSFRFRLFKRLKNKSDKLMTDGDVPNELSILLVLFRLP